MSCEHDLAQALRELGEAREEVAREHAAHEETWASHQQVREHRDDLAERLQTAARACDAAPRSTAELRGALELLELAEDKHANCPECEGDGIPELCPVCFPYFDSARVARRTALATHEKPLPDVKSDVSTRVGMNNDLAQLRTALASSSGEGS